MDSAAVGNDALEVAFLELSGHISAKCRAWQTLRVDKIGPGMNAIVELKDGWTFIVRVLGIAAPRLIFSILPGREEPFCVMVDGNADSQKWFADIHPALLHFISLM